MKRLYKIIFWAIAIAVAAYALLHIVFLLFGKAIIVSQIEKNLKVKASLESAYLGFPLSLHMGNLKIEDLARVENISFSPSMLGLFFGKIVLSDFTVIRPEITLEKESNGMLNLPYLQTKGKQPPVFLNGLTVKEGRLVFSDNTLTPQAKPITVNSINIRISKIAFPSASLHTTFDVTALLGEDEANPAGSAAFNGWIDFGPKDMDGQLELKDVDVMTFAPYFKNAIPLKKLVAPKLNFAARLEAMHNDLTAKCHVEIVNTAGNKNDNPPSGAQNPAELLSQAVDILSDVPPRKISFNFTYTTQLDNPKFDLNILKSFAIQSTIENILSQPPEDIKEKAKSAAKQFEAIGKEFKDIFKKPK